MQGIYCRDTCRLCGGKNLDLVLPLAPTALCDAYIPATHLKEVQEIYPLDLFMCLDCGYVNLPYVVDPEIIYRDYIYVTTSSMGLSDHFQKSADSVVQKIEPSEESLIIDIGSNDGTLLQYFKRQNMRVLGVEPATEIAQLATKAGIETIPEFFSIDLSLEIRSLHGPAKIVTMNNLFANIDSLREVALGVRNLLAHDGVFVVESSYLADMIDNMVFDFVYHEHLSYFTVTPLNSFFRRLEMELYDVERIPTKGGSLRYFVQLKDGPRKVSSSVSEMMLHEEQIGLHRVETFKAFSDRINSVKNQVVSTLLSLRAQGKSIAGYGGSATSTTLLYHFDLSKVIDYILDDNPAKQNTFSPGYHIPVLPPDVIYQRKPDYIIVLAWRYFEAIAKQHQGYLDQGGRLIRPLPYFEIVENLL